MHLIKAAKWLFLCILSASAFLMHSTCAICGQIDADFIAQYQMNYGCEETADSATSSQYSNDYWSNPPSDINSEEYRVWYERYCSYFYPEMVAEGDITSSSVDTSNIVEPDTLSVSADSSAENSAVDPSAAVDKVMHVDTEKAPDATNDTAADSTSGKKRKKGKKDGAANPKPAEPAGELLILASACLSVVLQFHYWFLLTIFVDII